MEKFGNELRVQQGEGFNLDLSILGGNAPDIPFIVTTAQAEDNACFVVTVASTKYEKNERYVKSWWNSLKEAEIPDFKGSTAIDCGELDDVGGEDANRYTFNNVLTKTELAGLVDMTHGIGTDFNGDTIYGIRAFIDDHEEGGTPSPYLYNYVSIFIKENGSWHWQDIYKNDGTESSDNGWIDNMRATYGTLTFSNEVMQDSSLVAWLNVEATNDSEPQTLPTQPGQGTFAEFTTGDDAQNRYLYRYTKKSDASEPSLGRKPYHYFYFVYDSEGEVDDTVDGYECKLTFNFLSTDTAEWTGQDYLYQITLVTGQLLDDRLNEIYNYEQSIGIDVSDWPETADTDEELTKLRYNYVKARWPDALQQDIDADSYLGTIDNPVPILRPTKIEVKNNLRRLI